MKIPPILLNTYNRPDDTQKVLDVIFKIKPTTIYISGDGPKDEEDSKKVGIVRAMLTQIDWKCRIDFNFSQRNLGLRKRMASALDWFFKNNSEGIILEDDCVADVSFFQYAAELLRKYRRNKNILHISGDNFLMGKKNFNKSYYFTKYPHCWGWASWRRAWKLYDDKMNDWPELRESNWLKQIVDNKITETYWRKVFDLTYAGKLNSWAYRWQYSIWLNKGVCINPNKNLVQNIGQSVGATNTLFDKSLESGKLRFPLRHPKEVKLDEQADRITERNRFITPRTMLGLAYKSYFG